MAAIVVDLCTLIQLQSVGIPTAKNGTLIRLVHRRMRMAAEELTLKR